MIHRAVFTLALCLTATAASAETLILANGDRITGEIVEWSVTHVVIDHPQLGQLRLSLDQLKLDTGEPPNPGLFGSTFLRGWERRIDLGLNGKQGNSVNSNLTGGLRFGYEDDWTRWKIDGRYFFNRDEDGVSDNNARLDLRRDWLIPDSDWFLTLGGRYQFDQFESWEHRITLVPSPGYHLVRSEKHKLDAMLGPAFTREFGTVDRSKGELAFSLDYRWNISERHGFSFLNNLFFEVVPNAPNIRNFTKLQYTVDLTKRLNVNAGLENEYETDPDPGDKSNDIKYFLSFGLNI